ncbi:type II toxin-antitoxin system RelB/DinJ family antitoxin [Klebsiella pneumoniae]|uniref:type II toxin-antitoxin system RelB/DinJ family antitoxin n=1 Tax=Enterobacteriaceae TaxID=543 RepID=UPI001E2FC3C1|nr:type II toxin-antitoxin system RelB/DinJ family antitoxin [Klebsiella pneumoniae]MCD5767421.1 type II toxin-antitoxin system RelB/DinJ family antitoxin [Klebsiella pneumoniae]UGN03080.1 type II toxin-antitoxin system RelB/DinJ family antitoxin [Klebsiella pneumoniae]
MAVLNIKIDGRLKESTDAKMKALNITPTKAITLLYHYISEHNRLPFNVNTVLRSSDEIKKIINDNSASAVTSLASIVNLIIKEGGIEKSRINVAVADLKMLRDKLKADCDTVPLCDNNAIYLMRACEVISNIDSAIAHCEIINGQSKEYLMIEYSMAVKINAILDSLERQTAAL